MSLDEMITDFIGQVRETENEGPAFSSVGHAAHSYPQHINLERLQRTISEAIVLLILALAFAAVVVTLVDHPIIDYAGGAHRRHSFTDASSNQHPPFTHNLDVIPGYAYFAIATNNPGGHAGGMNLPHTYVKEAGYALTTMLKQHLPRHNRIRKDMGNPKKQQSVKWGSG
ncbi:hypothetical protein V496_00357 [Pseudogymnoascus sp. VKM F-4515 (FW-2607)]|nr:hypothetical protein V496_00357 [Pseudogymnoascus sp. VKM F-4515 (FW-2607)]